MTQNQQKNTYLKFINHIHTEINKRGYTLKFQLKNIQIMDEGRFLYGTFSLINKENKHKFIEGEETTVLQPYSSIPISDDSIHFHNAVCKRVEKILAKNNL